MTIDEAIERELNIAHKGSDCWKHCSNTKKHCKDCMEEHEQLAEWLEELKAYREIGTVEECKESVLDIVSKSSDDFIITINKQGKIYEINLIHKVGDYFDGSRK